MKIEHFLEIIKTKLDIIESVRQQYSPVLAPKFNSFNFWTIDENKVSEILAFFLDPNGDHGQGDIFLKLFMGSIGIEYHCKNFNQTKVTTEFLTSANRRIDIVLNFDNDEFYLGIENKIYHDTPDQDNQVKDYLRYLETISKNQYCLLYLSPKVKGLLANSLSEEEQIEYISKNVLQLINYEDHIIDCIHQFTLQCESERVKSFLKDFEKLLTTMYLGETFMEDKNIIIKYAGESVENLEVTLKIANTVNAIKDNLRSEFYKQLAEISAELNLEIIEKRYFLIPNLYHFKISFSFEEGGLIYGISRLDGNNSSPVLPLQITENIKGKWKSSNIWPIYKHMYSNIEVDTDFWLDIKNRTVKEKAKEFIKEIISYLKLNQY